MTAGTHYRWFHSDVGRNYWLPPYGRGNGYDAPAWAPIANLPEELVDHLLAALAAADVPAHAAQPGMRKTAQPWCVWVGHNAMPPPRTCSGVNCALRGSDCNRSASVPVDSESNLVAGRLGRHC